MANGHKPSIVPVAIEQVRDGGGVVQGCDIYQIAFTPMCAYALLLVDKHYGRKRHDAFLYRTPKRRIVAELRGIASRCVPATMLMMGTPDDVSEYCEKLIQMGMKGGFMLGSGCEVPMNAKPENVAAMIASVRKGGLSSSQTHGFDSRGIDEVA